MQPPYKRKYKSYFTRSEIAQMFEVAPNTVNRWVRGGKLPSVVTPGGRRRYPVDAILRLIPAPYQQDLRNPSREGGVRDRQTARRKAPGRAVMRSRPSGA